MFEECRLDTAIHDRAGFDCGIAELNHYLHRLADQHRRKSVSTTFVLVNTQAPTTILGYYCLSAAQVDVEQLLNADRNKLPRYPVPCFRMGRLAVRQDQQGQGFGRLLLACAVDRCLKARQDVAGYALIVDAKSELARQFYEHYGFTRLRDAPMTLYLPLGK